MLFLLLYLVIQNFESYGSHSYHHKINQRQKKRLRQRQHRREGKRGLDYKEEFLHVDMFIVFWYNVEMASVSIASTICIIYFNTIIP